MQTLEQVQDAGVLDALDCEVLGEQVAGAASAARAQVVRRIVGKRLLDAYVVTTILREVLGPAATTSPREYESPFFASFDDRVVPHAAPRPAAGQAWVVPNPYRAHAAWERLD